MECNKCGEEMEIEERVEDTRIADVSIEKWMVCEECGNEYLLN